MSVVRRALPVALATGLLGCFSLGPIWVPRVEGIVVDAETGEPLAGAEVFASYFTPRFDLDDKDWFTTVTTDSAWGTTDRDGRFAIPAHLAIDPVSGGFVTHWYPWLFAYHPDYGALEWPNNWHYPAQDAEKERQFFRAVVFEMKAPRAKPGRPAGWIGLFEKGACRSGKLTDAACERLCEVSVGLEACARRDAEFEAWRRDQESARRAGAAEPIAPLPDSAITPASPGVFRPRVTVPED